MEKTEIINKLRDRAERNVSMAARLFNDFIESDNPVESEHFRSEHYRYIDRAYEDLNLLNELGLISEAEVEIFMGDMLCKVRRYPDDV